MVNTFKDSLDKWHDAQTNATESNQAIESDIERVASITGVKDQAAAKKILQQAELLLAGNHGNEAWWSGFSAHDIGFKRLVFNRMKDLGIELDNSEVEAMHADNHPHLNKDEVDKQVGDEMNDAHSKMQKELAALYAESDAQIAALMRDQSLTDAERRVKIAEIEAGAKAKASEMFAKQKEMSAREAAIESQLAKYQQQVNQAEEQTNAAIEQGDLSPEVAGLTRKMHDANVKMATVKTHPLFSAVELHTNSEKENLRAMQKRLQSENDVLEGEDDTLAEKVDELERKLRIHSF